MDALEVFRAGSSSSTAKPTSGLGIVEPPTTRLRRFPRPLSSGGHVDSREAPPPPPPAPAARGKAPSRRRARVEVGYGEGEGEGEAAPPTSTSAPTPAASAPPPVGGATPPRAAKRRAGGGGAVQPPPVIGTPTAPVGGGEGGGGAASNSSSTGAWPALEVPPNSPARGYGKPITPSHNWRLHLENIKAMRGAGGAASGAAVDSMGCELCADPAATPPVRRFQTLVGLMLSSQTRDEVTFAAVQRLIKSPALGGCSPAGVSGADVKDIEAALFGPPAVGFWRNKARFVKETAALCVSRHGGDIPDTIAGLCALPGVGPKMAFITLSAAWGRPVGIGVDTHVHRITNRLGWVRTETPEATREHLQSWLPREEWGPLNVMLVGFGQTVCTPVAPRCTLCSNAPVCSVATGHRSPQVKKV